MATWTHDDIPAQTSRTVIVTGANTGIGFETARALARKGARVVLACRSLDRGRAAVDRIMAESPEATVTVAELDLADLRSVEAFAERFMANHDRLDLLILNAGVMIPPAGKTAQGFELQRSSGLMQFLNRIFAMQPPQGALPTLRAAVDPAVNGGEYFGPDGFLQMRGHPERIDMVKQACSDADAARLWEVSEELTGVQYGLAAI